MTYKIFIDGEAGTTGLEIKKRLSGLNDLELLSISEGLRKDTAERIRLYKEANIVFLCLPDAESKAILMEADQDMRIIDASTAHRTHEDWIYGLPELEAGRTDMIRKSNRVANPGCHATGYILLIRPLIDAGLLDKDMNLSVHSITGYSGGGKDMIANYRNDGTRRNENKKFESPGQYGLTQTHKHLPEMLKYSNMGVAPVFMPIVADYYRGMLVSIPIQTQTLGRKTGLKDLINIYKERYEGHQLISVMTEEEASENGFIYADRLGGRDDLQIIVSGNDDRITLMARYDNLGKGASGAAIQNMNIMLGLPEYQGLIK